MTLSNSCYQSCHHWLRLEKSLCPVDLLVIFIIPELQMIQIVMFLENSTLFCQLCFSFFPQRLSTSGPCRPVFVHHVVQVENNLVPEALCLCLQMGTHQREGQAPHAQPSHQQSELITVCTICVVCVCQRLKKVWWLNRTIIVIFFGYYG